MGGPVLLVLVVLAACIGLMWWIATDQEPDLGTDPATPASPTSPANPAPRAAPAPPAIPAPTAPPAANAPGGAALPERKAAAPAVEIAPLVIRVLRSDRTPVADARVAVFREESTLKTGRTKKDGSFTTGGSRRAVSVIAAPGDTLPHLTELRVGFGDHEVVLPAGARVAGVIRVDGAPPPKEFLLQLWGDDDVSRDRELPKAVRAFLSCTGRHWLELRGVPDAAGRFRFHGLPAAWKGFLSWPRGFVSEQDPGGFDRAIDIPRPGSGIVLDLYRKPEWTGRVLTEDREPLPRARVNIQHETNDGELGSTGTRTDAEGRFRNRLPRFAFARATVTVTGPKGLARTTRRIESPRAGNHDLGDFVLAAPHEIRFRVKGPDGKPIAGAVATAVTNPGAHSKATAKDGTGAIRVAADERELDVAAIGHAVKRVAIPASPPDPLPVVLDRGTRLTVKVVTPDDQPLRRFWVRVESSERLFATDDGGLHPAYVYAGANNLSGGQYGKKSVEMDFRIAPGHEAELAGLMPGVRFKVRAFHPASGYLAEETLQLGAGEWREVKLVVAEKVREFHGTVVDPRGEPIRRAEITISADRDRKCVAYSNDKGIFEIGHIWADEVFIEVEKQGYIPFVGRARTVRPDSEPSRIVLTPGRTVEVSVVDPIGRPLDDADLAVTLPDIAGWDGKPHRVGLVLEDGLALAEGLPTGTVTFEIDLAGKRYARPHDTNLSTARFVLPAHGRLAIRWTERTATDRSRKLILTPKSERGGPRIRWLPHGSVGRFVFSNVLPDEYELRIVAADTEEDPGRLLVTQPGLTVVAGRTNRFAVGR